jgi:hypothetical protein
LEGKLEFRGYYYMFDTVVTKGNFTVTNPKVEYGQVGGTNPHPGDG